MVLRHETSGKVSVIILFENSLPTRESVRIIARKDPSILHLARLSAVLDLFLGYVDRTPTHRADENNSLFRKRVTAQICPRYRRRVHTFEATKRRKEEAGKKP